MTIPIQPDFYKGVDSQKVDIDTQNANIGDQKADIDAQNVNIGSQKADIDVQNVDIEILKERYQNVLRENGYNKTTIDNVFILLDKVGIGVVFGRSDIISNTGLGKTAASDLINKMADAGVTESVEGLGKSKYMFRK